MCYPSNRDSKTLVQASCDEYIPHEKRNPNSITDSSTLCRDKKKAELLTDAANRRREAWYTVYVAGGYWVRCGRLARGQS